MIMQQYFDSAHLASLETQFASQETRYSRPHNIFGQKYLNASVTG